jgi:hypothetical protein
MIWTSSPDEPADGDCDALTALVQEPRHLTCRLALRFVGHLNDAKNATQDSLIRIVTRLGTLRTPLEVHDLGLHGGFARPARDASTPGRILGQGTQGIRRVPRLGNG